MNDDSKTIEPPTPIGSKKKRPNLKPGDVVFFKRCKDTAAANGQFVEFQGHGFGVLLGMVPPFQADPPKDFVVRLLGSLGYVLLDDIQELMGEEHLKELLQKFHGKYAPTTDPAQPELPLEGDANQESEPPRSKLLDANGKPISEVH